MNRRTFLAAASAAGAASAMPAPPKHPIIDTHIHLFDPRRPGGIPWPPKDNPTLFKPALPDRYRALATPHGITGAIEVECSPLVEDNQWVLDVMKKDPIMLGTVGDLEPGLPGFRQNLDRFHKNPLFLGIRCGNLWGRDLAADSKKPAFIADLKALADAGLVMDSANQNQTLLDTVVRITDQVPNLRIVIDHLPQFIPADSGRPAYEATLKELSARPQVYVKVSEVLRRVDGRVPEDPAWYAPRIDELWRVFGEDRLLYGSDWPNSDQWGPYSLVFHIVKTYFDAKGPVAAEKYFWRNSLAAYRWKKRR